MKLGGKAKGKKGRKDKGFDQGLPDCRLGSDVI